VAMSEHRAQTATKMTTNILHDSFSLSYLATQTIAGGDSDKDAMDQDIGRPAVCGVSCRHFVFVKKCLCP